MFLLSLFLSGCLSHRYTPSEVGIWVKIKPGETVASIAKKYQVSRLELLKHNEIIDPEDLSAGMLLFVPGATRGEDDHSEVRFPQMSHRDPVLRSGKRLIWPAGGTISSGFGMRHGRMHEGVDITADGGNRVVAAGSGVVEFSGKMRGYGNVLIINHGHGIKTLYGHNKRNFVRKGQHVRQGQRIALLGSTGHSTGPHLHFEVKINNKAVNPLRYLPIR